MVIQSQNFIPLAGKEVNLGLTLFQDCPDMVSKNRYSIDIGLILGWLGVEIFSAVAGLRMKIGKKWS